MTDPRAVSRTAPPTAPPAGLNVTFDPRAERLDVPAQQQSPPGREGALRPPTDHGESSYMGANRLLGKKALVTGADSGIGRAIALAFAREGADVAFGYLSERQDADETLRLIREAEREGLAVPGDLASAEACRRLVQEAVGAMGRIDVLVPNAGVHLEIDRFEDLTAEQIERVFRTNLFAPMYLIQAALPHMAAGASIVLTGSVTGLRGSGTLPDYAASKAGVHNLVKSLAPELAERGVRINAVAPGPVWTPLIAATRKPEAVDEFGKDTVWKRAAMPAELAPSYVFLASADARYYTGQILSPTGGD